MKEWGLWNMRGRWEDIIEMASLMYIMYSGTGFNRLRLQNNGELM
jgi:hypothetical protein